MQIAISYRHLDSTAAINEFATERLNHAVRHFDGAARARIVLSQVEDGFTADLELHDGASLRASATEADLYEAISAAGEKLSRQIDKAHERAGARVRSQA